MRRRWTAIDIDRSRKVMRRQEFFTRWAARRYQKWSIQASTEAPRLAGILAEHGSMWHCIVLRTSETQNYSKPAAREVVVRRRGR